MTALDRSKVYVFLLRGPGVPGDESIAAREWTGRAWKTRRVGAVVLAGDGPWRVLRSERPLWRRGPRMVLEVQA